MQEVNYFRCGRDGNKRDGSTWILYDSDIVHDKNLHIQDKVLMLWPYHFVQIDGCNTGADYNQLPDEFIPRSFLSWKHTITLPLPENEWWYNKHGRNTKNWTIRFWTALGKGKSVNDAVKEAGEDETTRDVAIYYDLVIYGDNFFYLK